MFAKHPRARVVSTALVFVLLPVLAWAQSFNGSIGGTVTDPSGAVVPSAELTLTSVATAAVRRLTTGPDGLYLFGNLQQGAYDLQVAAKGFRDYIQRGATVNVNESVRLNVKLEIGAETQTIEVTGLASPLNFENAEVKQAVNPDVIGSLPLLVQGNTRSVANFIVLAPGVTTGGGGNSFDARINGGMQMGDEAVLDGVTMQQGLMSQSGMVSLGNDYPMTPEATSEVTLLTSNYEPQYGSTTSGVITAVTKSGTREFHGELHEYFRNTVLNARQYGIDFVPKDQENEFGGSIGGPLKEGIPFLSSGKNKTFFFTAFDEWYIRGGSRRPILSIPTEKMRAGDFSEWPDPIFDPATTHANPNFDPNQDVGPDNLPFLRNQFMGCAGNTPNVICPSDPRLQTSLPKRWLDLLPPTNFAGPLNNFISPVAIQDISGADSDHRTQIDWRIDHYRGEKDHFSWVTHYKDTVFRKSSALPPMLASEGYITKGGEIGPWAHRLNWDHTFSPTLLNNANYGYLNMRGAETAVDKDYASQMPQIPGAASFNSPPLIGLEDYETMGHGGLDWYESRPTNVVNDLLTWVRGRHTFKFGGELRKLELSTRNNYGYAGEFHFTRGSTGLLGLPSGNSVASFLLGQVDFGTTNYVAVDTAYMRSSVWSLHAGDTWKVTPNLSINYGIRWDVAKPSVEKWNHLAFFDPEGSNPGAGNRPGRVAWAGDRSLLLDLPYGDAGFERRTPEKTSYSAFAPRLGLAYALGNKTVVRAGYGIFYLGSYYPGWGGGAALDGFMTSQSQGSSQGGMTAAFLLSQGLPPLSQLPPTIDRSFLNGKGGPTYRPFDGNQHSYSQQWNLTVEHQLTNTFHISAAYVGNKGTRLLSQKSPLNALNPSLLSRGPALFDEFGEGQAELDGVSNPYAGWETQLSDCSPSVAQALLPYPQYCGGLTGLNEHSGNSTYHSFQFKAEKRYAQGFFLLASYTFSKQLTDADIVQSVAGASSGVISPFEMHRNKALALEDVPQTLSTALIYDLPVGKGKRVLSGGGVASKILGGWGFNTVLRVQSGVPFAFRSSACTVPDQFHVACIPAILPGADPFAQSKGDYDPGKGPLFNANAFESPDSFNFYYGQGPRVSNLRGFGYHNQDFTLYKRTQISESVGVEFRAEFFNMWNWHILTCSSHCFGDLAFDNDVSSPSFGEWNGSVSVPRTIQFGLKIMF
jgi:carboxypeptidase family protein